MNKAIKSILKPFGLYKGFRQFYLDRERKKYENFDICSMDYKGVQLTFDTRDTYSNRWFYPRFGWGQIHEPGTTKVFFDYVKEGSNVFDIGGHLGYFSCIAGKLSKTGTVCVFEVDANCIDIIHKNAKHNHLDNVNVYHIAVSDSNGFVSIPVLHQPDPGTRIELSRGDDHVKIPSLTIDEFVAKEGIIPDFMKIDVEGAEFKVLKGMESLLKNENLTLLVEIHVKQLAKYFDTDYREVLKFLSDQGFSLEMVESHRSKTGTLRKIDYTETLKKNEMLLCKK